MNFIIKLLKLKKRVIEIIYNFILIVTNKLIKYKYFLSYKEVIFVENLTYTFLRTIVTNYKLLDYYASTFVRDVRASYAIEEICKRL